MPTLLRRIRQTLTTQGNSSRYLIYAMGEIILVVVGILIALQINNWNEEQQKREQELILFENIVLDLESDILQLQQHKVTVLNRSMRIDSALQVLSDPQFANKRYFIEQMYLVAFDTYFISTSSIFDEAVASGKLSFIQNKELLEGIFSYYRTAKTNYTDEAARKNTDNFIVPMLFQTIALNKEAMNNFGYGNSSYHELHDLEGLDIPSLRSNKKFWEMILSKSAYSTVQIERWNELEGQAKALKNKLNRELEKVN